MNVLGKNLVPVSSIAHEIAQGLRSGASICVEGGWGSGRTTLADQVIRQLELTGTTTFHLRGRPLLRPYPFAVLSQAFEIPPRAQERGPVGVADVLARELASNSSVSCVISDAEYVDDASLATIDLLYSREAIPVCITVPQTPQTPLRVRQLVETWGLRKIRLEPLQYDQVAAFVEQTLGGPTHRELVSKIFTESAGNPKLVTALLQVGTANGLIAQTDGIWAMTSWSLWHDDLEAWLDGLLAPIPKAKRDALSLLVLLGPQPLSTLQEIIDHKLLAELEVDNYITMVGTNDPTASIHPPILGECLRRRASQVVKANAQRILNRLGEPPYDIDVPAVLNDTESIFEVAEDAALAHLFDQQASIRAEALWRLWQSNPTFQQGLAFLQQVWNTPRPHVGAEQVIESLDVNDCGTAWEGLQFASMKAEWFTYQVGDADRGFRILEDFGKLRPEMAEEALAYRLFMRATMGQLPATFASQLTPTGDEPTGSIQAIVKAFLHMVHLRPREALAALALSPGGTPCLLEGLSPMVEALSLYQLGETEAAQSVSATALREARRRLDKPGILSTGYGACLILYQEGRWNDAERLMGSVFSSGRPGMVTEPLYAALLRVGAFLIARAGRPEKSISLLKTADEVNAHHSALPGMSPRLSATARHLIAGDRLAAAAECSRDVLDQRERGFLFAALGSARMALSLHPTAERLAQLEDLAAGLADAKNASLIAVARGVVDRDAQALEAAVDLPFHTGNEVIVSAIFDSALAVSAVDDDFREALVRARERFNHRFPQADLRKRLAPLHTDTVLSEREREIALLVGSLGNAAIAERLDLSVRTVENHVYNAIKKTGVEGRDALFAFASSQLKQ